MKRILFYRTREPYGEFSNFSPYPIKIRGKEWPTSEHYFQAQKFAGTEYEERIRQTGSPMIAARMERSRAQPIRGDWDRVKDDIMREGRHAKFNQHPNLRSLLLSTGEAEIIEHTSKDGYWGDGGGGSGRNRLGELLMELRRKLRSQSMES